MTEAFSRGDLVLRRHFQGELLSRVWCGHVAADDEFGLWIWVASGSAYRDLGPDDGRHLRDIDFADWPAIPKAFDTRPWNGNVLMLHPHEGDYSVWQFYNDGELDRHYVNLELPGTRWRDRRAGGHMSISGIDTVDYDLDVIVAPDLTWSWKDEAEFAERLRHPEIYWVKDEAAVRAEGARLAKLAEAGEFPFDGTRSGWPADPSWPVPSVMPPGWDRPRAK